MPGKFLQNPFLGCQWSPWRGKIIWSAVESFYLMIWTKFQKRNLQSIRKLLRKNPFLKILCSGFYCTDNYFSLLETPLASQKWILKEFFMQQLLWVKITPALCDRFGKLFPVSICPWQIKDIIVNHWKKSLSK